MLATAKMQFALFIKEIVYVRLGLECRYIIEPIAFWSNVFVRTDENHIATLQLGLHRAELTIDACIVGMQAKLAMDFKGEIECRCTLWQDDALTVRCIGFNIIVIE